jgi:branched-chain amino acid transport system ATP-binding protein
MIRACGPSTLAGMPMRELLRLSRISAGYRRAVVLNGVDLSLEEGQSIALLGRNGAGKTTLVDTIVGVTTRFAGTILLDGADITHKRPEERAAFGIGWVPQERNIFKSLTVLENLTAVARPGPWTVSRVTTLFPRLEERKNNLGNQLSGGEQQMLAIARALVLNPKILLLDEPMEGLAPIIVEELSRTLRGLFQSGDLAGIIVEQHAQKVLAITDAAIILDRGAMVHRAPSADLRADSVTLQRLLGVSGKPSTPQFSGALNTSF